MEKITFYAEDVPMPLFREEGVREWIAEVVRVHGRTLGSVAYCFCSDRHILKVNREFLQHDYFTDIITFDYCRGRRVTGDIVISLDTVKSNAPLFGTDPRQEFFRVLIHGILHLCGINDKGPGEREVMERHENEALEMLRNYEV